MSVLFEPVNQQPYSCIYNLLKTQAEQQPDCIAIAAPDRTPLTYSQLFQQVHTVLVQLRTAGITGRDCIAVVLPNGAEMAVTFLAVAAAATCAPLNPAYRATEFDFYLSDLQAKALLIQAGMDSPAIAVAQERNIPIIELHSTLNAVAGTFSLDLTQLSSVSNTQTSAAIFPAQPDDVALILHTSGTTSRPKMVPLTHTNLCSSAWNIAQTLRLQPSDRCLNVMPLFHIHGLIAALLSSMASGGSVVCTPGFDASAFFPWLEQFSPTWYSAVPTIHQAILGQTDGQQAVINRHPLRFIRSSSAALPARVMAEIEASFGVPVIEAYGMTEASHQMASNPLPPAVRKPRSVGLAGQTTIAIAAPDRNELLPQGEVGEVVIQGTAVTPGYLSNPEANTKAFFNGWFRTGDQGYIDADGYLFLQGRLKEVINRGGEKISPVEVDEALMELPEVHQAVAFAVPHSTLGEDLVAAVVLKPDAQITPTALRNYLFSQVADFKVPSQIIIVETIPKGATGKLQRIGLADRLAEHLKTDYVAPRNDREQAIANVISAVLQCEPVGVTENFFVLGGDSLKGTQVASRLSAQFGVELSNTAIFRYPTVAELAEEITRLMTDDQVVQDLLVQLKHLPPDAIERLLATSEE